MKFLCHDVLDPEPNIVGGVTVGWNLGFRAVIGSPERFPGGLLLREGARYYSSMFDFRGPADSSQFPSLNDEWCIEPCPSGGFQMRIPKHETVVVGLGITVDFGSFNWVHGSISLRKRWMLAGLELVNTNTPIHGGHRNEIFVLLRNNGPSAQTIDAHSHPVQIHFYQGLLSPVMEVCRVADATYMI